MTPLKHIYPIRNEEIISELSPTDVKINILEHQVDDLQRQVKYLSDLVHRQTAINVKITEIINELNSRL